MSSMRVEYFVSVAGAVPVRDYIESLPEQERAPVADALLALAKDGLSAPGVDLRHIDGKLWELRVKAQRVFYMIVTGPTMILLHAYRKQGQKAPLRELEVARKRASETRRRH